MGRRQLWLAMMIGGAAAAALGAGLGGLLLLFGLLAGGSNDLVNLLPGGSAVALALGLGGAVAYQGWAGWRGRPTRSFPPTTLWWLVAALVLALGMGAVIAQLEVISAVFLLPFHIITMTLPPLILLAITGRAFRGQGETWRDMIAGLGGGGLLGMPLVLVAEAALVVALGVIAGALILSTPGGIERILALLEELQDPALLGDSQRLLDLAQHPVVVMTLVGLMGIAVPLIEEVLKTLAVGVAGAWARPAPARAFLWGVASGAGFAIAENLLNGAVLDRGVWGVAAVARVGASAMHCFTGGLVGWGWGQLWATGRARRFVAGLAGAGSLHAFWNLAAVVPAVLSMVARGHGDDALWEIISGVGAATVAVVLGALALAAAIALPVVARRLAKGPAPEASLASVSDSLLAAAPTTGDDGAPHS